MQDDIEAGITTVQERSAKERLTPRRALSFLDEDDDGTNSSAGALTALINKARESVASADANTNTPEPTVPAELVVAQPETAEAAAGVR